MPNKGLIGIKASQTSSADQSGMHTLNDLHEEQFADNWPIPTTTILSINRNGNVSTYQNGTNSYIHHASEHVHTITVLHTKNVTWYLWGAAGGGGIYSTLRHGGNGGLAYGTVEMQAGTTYYLYVGKAGGNVIDLTLSGISGYDLGGTAGWPNGGYGTMGDASGAGGGGMTMLSKAAFSTSMSDSDILLIAGGGGGTTGYFSSAGSGGGTTGEDAASGVTGGSQSAGGTYNGAKLQGGNATGNRTSGSDDGGGGGGGYYGGGGGTSDAKPGAGGSGYINTTLVSNSAFGTSSTQAFSGSFNTRINPPDVNNIWSNSMDTTQTSNTAVYARGGLSKHTNELDGGNGFAYITIAA
mgnify:CR=1 FL=1